MGQIYLSVEIPSKIKLDTYFPINWRDREKKTCLWALLTHLQCIYQEGNVWIRIIQSSAFIRSVTHPVVSLQNRTSASINCTGVFLQNESPSLPHITHLLEKENLDMILTILILREPPKSSSLWGHLNPVIVSFYPVFHPSQLCPLARYPLLKSDTKPHSSDLWLTLTFPALHPFRFPAYSIN